MIFVLCVVLEIVSSTIRRSLLGVEPVGETLGDRLVRVTRRRSRSEADAAAAADASMPSRSGATVESMLRRPWTATRVRNTVWLVVAVGLVIASYWLARVDFDDITWSYVVPTLQSFWPPNFGSHTLADFGQALLVTVEVAFAAAFLSLVISLVFGSLAARTVAPNAGVRSVFRVLLVVFRGVPELVLAIFLIMVTGLGNQAGVVALAFGGIGLLGKLIADSFEELPPGPDRALTAVGATRTQRYFAATWPRGLRSLIGNSFYLVDTNIRSATLLGIVGGSGVGFYLTNASSVLTLHGQVTTLVTLVLVTVLAVEGIAAWMRHVFK
ncbi:hypothetical protein GCM10025867_36760 [Frondihabitans sucicola]|uniref:ABC transmembrane type-1 domain-containing protein n=1 Tax=Frondihabitans sucicola TaxID=1268041 RepID=A0ABM8GSH7_9MICO|nr:hypothetical protein GCM10025867_36760 [Frondihabitans sucicola]